MNVATSLQAKDYAVSFIAIGLLSAATTGLSFYLGLFVIVWGALVSLLLVGVTRWLVKAPHTPQLYWLAAAATLVGGLPVAVATYYNQYRYAAIFEVGFVVVAAFYTYAQLSGLGIDKEAA